MMKEVREWYEMAAADLGVAVGYPNELLLEERHVKEALPGEVPGKPGRESL